MRRAVAGGGARGRGEVRGAVEHHDEFVAAEAGGGVDRANFVLQPARDADQQGVADGVAEAVVDELESIEVEEEQREVVVRITLCAGEGLADAVGEQGAIGQPGEPVVQRRPSQVGLGVLQLGDVGERAGQPRGMSLPIPDRRCATQHPTGFAVVAPHLHLDLEVLGGPCDVGVERAPELRKVAGQDAPEPLLGIRAHLLVRAAEHLLPVVRVVDAPAVEVPVPDGIPRPGHREREALFAAAQLGFGRPALALGRPVALAQQPTGDAESGGGEHRGCPGRADPEGAGQRGGWAGADGDCERGADTDERHRAKPAPSPGISRFPSLHVSLFGRSAARLFRVNARRAAQNCCRSGYRNPGSAASVIFSVQLEPPTCDESRGR